MGRKWWVAPALVLLAALLMGMEPLVPDQGYGAKGVCVIEAETGRVLYEQNAREQLPMASTTKIMTTLLALERQDLDQEFVVDTDAIHIEGSSMGLQDGDTVTLRALCYGMMLPSGNDAANATAVRLAGSQVAFADLMNRRARELGLEDTHFITPSGLDDDNHYSTAYDMAMLQRAAMEDRLYIDISSQMRARTRFGNPPYDRWLQNHNRLIEMYDGVISGKTGFTDTARRCLVSAARRDGVTLICVTLNAPDDWNIHKALYTACFDQLSQVDAAAKVGAQAVPVVGALAGGSLPVAVAPEEGTFPVAAGEEAQVDCTLLLPAFVYAPVSKGDVVGEAVFTLGGEELYRAALVAQEDAKAAPVPEKKSWFSWWKGK